MVVTILTGARPELLRKTLESTFIKMPGLLAEKIIALHNGSDLETGIVLQEFNITKVVQTHEIIPIGEAISILAELAANSGQEYWLHLEDDWEAVGTDLIRAQIILAKNPNIAQVRCRRATDTVLTKHMVTGEPIRWGLKVKYAVADAHLTFNPFVMRTMDIPKAFPCTGERDAQRRWLDNGMTTSAQLYPGIWTHIGDDNSLRKQTECEV